MASTVSASTLVSSVLPIARLTALFFRMPNLLTMGYVIRVCEANILASSTEVMSENFSIQIPAAVPSSIGRINPYRPSRLLLPAFLRKSFISISSPDRNMIYNRPAVPERMILLSRVIRLNPYGPMITPASIIPSRGGTFSLSETIGINRMISRMMRNFSTGSARGR